LCLYYRGCIEQNFEFINQAFSFIKEYKKAEAGKAYYFVENKRPIVYTGQVNNDCVECIGIKNYSGIYTFWENILKKFENHYSKKTDLNKLLSDGVEEKEFTTCIESFKKIIDDYKQFQTATADD
jgi:hypothetical protein